MGVEIRILTCRLLEKMKIYEACGKRLGLEDASWVHDRENMKGAKGWRRKGKDEYV